MEPFLSSNVGNKVYKLNGACIYELRQNNRKWNECIDSVFIFNCFTKSKVI